MPRYVYRAKDLSLNVVEGDIEADSEAAAVTRLSSLGVFPITLAEVATAGRASGGGPSTARQRVTPRTLALMSRQLADLLGGGIPLFKALALLAEQTEDRTLRGVIADVGEAVRDGQAFSQALGRHPQVFSSLYLSMITAGETSGGLDSVLTRLADLLESESELRGRIASALVYPCVVLVIGLITIIVLLTYVVPKLTTLFTEVGQEPPLPTRILLAISGTLTHGWWVCLAAAAVGWWSLRMFRLSPGGRATLDRGVLRVPLAGTLVRKQQIARFVRNLGVMVGQGVPVLQALSVAAATLSNTVLKQVVTGVQQAVREGETLAGALAASKQFPAFVSNMVAVGEESGTLDGALLKVAGSYERETDRTLRTFTTVLEPLVIVLVGLVVMFIVISMLLPIFQLGLVAQ